MIEHIKYSLTEAHDALAALLANEETLSRVQQAAQLLIETFETKGSESGREKGRVLSCGNGGSMCDAMHFAEELTGRYRLDRAPLPATAISDAGHLTCVGNDYGYEHVFSRYLEAHGRAGDCLVAMSTSGSSQNVIQAARSAQALGIKVIVLSGKRSAELESLSDVHICTPAGHFADRVQELHIKVLHILIELVERHVFPANYVGVNVGVNSGVKVGIYADVKLS